MRNVYLLLNKQPDYNIYYYQGLQSELFLILMFSKLIEFHELHFRCCLLSKLLQYVCNILYVNDVNNVTKCNNILQLFTVKSSYYILINNLSN